MSATAPPRRFAVLVNPAAARGRALARIAAVEAELDGLGSLHRTVVTRSIEHAAEEASAAAGAGETVLAVGGDGFVGPVAGALRGAAGALAVVPGGRGNDFARALGIPGDPRAATRLAVQGEERLVDVGTVDGRPFLGIASVGVDSDVQDIANATRLVGGGPVYVYAALRALAGWRHASFEAVVDDERHRVHGYAVAVGNSGVYGGGMRLMPDAKLEDGLLDVLLVGRHSKLRYLSGLPKVFRGTHLEGNPAARLVRGSAVELSADRPFRVYADGDPIAELPVTIGIETRTLRVISAGTAA
ncbi:MAG: diacylglycerol/lipid kinase family protein [Thermoleophilaceae bacterium]